MKKAEREIENSDLERDVINLNPVIDGIFMGVGLCCQIMGGLYAVLGNGEHHIRDGALVFAAGSLAYYAPMAVSYLKDIRDSLKEK